MPRPNVTIRVVDDSLVVPTTETISPTNGAMMSRQGLKDLGVNAGETAAGLYFVENLNNWYGRLRSYAEAVLIIEGYTGATLIGTIGVTAANFVNPSSSTKKNWYKEWWAVHNFLQYWAVGVSHFL